jgi:hypothetical protein
MKTFALLLTFACQAVAGDFYVSPNGNGNGTKASPWELTYALSGAGGTIKAGDTVYCLGGTYLNSKSGQTPPGGTVGRDGYVAFRVSVNTGTANSPVIFRAVPGQRAIWDALNTVGADVVRFETPHVWLWGIEIMSSDPYRLVTINTDGDWSYPNPAEMHVGVGTNFAPVDVPNPETVRSFELFQNYPNPFNPSTVIRFEVAQTVYVRLDIYSVLGEKIGAVLEGVRTPGIYDVPVDMSEYASGTYYYALKAGSFVAVKRFTLMR